LPTALILDDEADIRELLEITLNRMPLNTHAAASLQAAKKLPQDCHFDLRLTDLKLPDGDGVELAKHIQTHYNHMPVAVITAYGSMEPP
jgi:two-component system response regulator PilR (NtrC family)